MPRITAAIILSSLMLTGCGGTYIDDKNNFERSLGFQQPTDVQLVHSTYWQSAHWTNEHCYYLELLPAAGSSIQRTLTSLKDVAPLQDAQHKVPPSLAVERPTWFAPKSQTSYEIWVSIDSFSSFGVLRDKKDGRLFVYGQVL